MVDIDGVISLFGAAGDAGDRSARGLLPLDRGHTPLPFVHRRRSPARRSPSCSSWCGPAAGKSGPTNTSPTCSGCPAGCRSCASSARCGRCQRPLEARGDRRICGDAPAGLDRRRLQRGLPRLGRARARRPRCWCRPTPSTGSPRAEARAAGGWARELPARAERDRARPPAAARRPPPRSRSHRRAQRPQRDRARAARRGA